MTTDNNQIDNFEQLDPRQYILIKGARVHNLKNINVAIPRNKLVVVTGLSGSGKSSLAFDTLFTEGQRMYVESLNSYARQFLGRMGKPDVDYIKGISPAIAIEQKVNTRNPRSTVGTSTEIYDYLKLLFARIGKTISPVSGKEVSKDTVDSVCAEVYKNEDGTKIIITAPLHKHEGRSWEQELELLLQKGFTRVYVNDEMVFVEELLADKDTLKSVSEINILIDRTVVSSVDEDARFRLADSVQTAFYEGLGICNIQVQGKEVVRFSDRFELDGISFEEPSANLFSFNNPYGACKTCEGFGHVLGIDPDLVIPNKAISVYEGAIMPWRGEKMSEYVKPLLVNGIRFDFPIHRPYFELTDAEKELLWTGNKHFTGLNDFFQMLAEKSHQIQYRVMLSRYRGRTTCPDCRGSRLRKDASYVKINGLSITDMVLMPLGQLYTHFENLQLTDFEEQVASRLVLEIKNRLGYINKVGLGYLNLNRLTSTLSGGEFQRIKLATSLGSALVGSMYILDEPSIGLHPRDTQRLIEVLIELRNLGNTVIVVEHEEEVMRAADLIIDIGPEAGARGGHLVNQGTLEQITNNDAKESYTFKFLKGIDTIPVPKFRRQWNKFIEVVGARENNLQNVTVKFPLEVLSVITGVSGSGKSTLVKKILYPSLQKLTGNIEDSTGKYDRLDGNYNTLSRIEFVDQNPIGKSSRSNPVTYIKAYDLIRNLYSEQPLAKTRAYKPAHFSFNVDGGRCDTCQGEGEIKIEMQFMADVHLECESCKGKRFKQEVLEIKYKDLDISDVLNLTVEEAITFFAEKPKIIEKIEPLFRVGLGYVKLGQSSNTLSGGEAQRVKLGSFLAKGEINKDEKILFVFDEPTTGLHFHDIKKLLDAINALVEQGHSVVIIEHNMEVIKCADWIIDLGPDSGDNGGLVVFEGTPEEMVKSCNSFTATYLKEKM
ncbi:MAG: excinuclease subunit UvrA [Bacteroidota bacterium]|jgi:excinuclease ABC subunit A